MAKKDKQEDATANIMAAFLKALGTSVDEIVENSATNNKTGEIQFTGKLAGLGIKETKNAEEKEEEKEDEKVETKSEEKTESKEEKTEEKKDDTPDNVASIWSALGKQSSNSSNGSGKDFRKIADEDERIQAFADQYAAAAQEA